MSYDSIFMDVIRFHTYGCHTIPFLWTPYDSLFTDTIRFHIYGCQSIPYLRMPNDSIFMDAIRLHIYGCHMIPYLRMLYDSIFTDAIHSIFSNNLMVQFDPFRHWTRYRLRRTRQSSSLCPLTWYHISCQGETFLVVIMVVLNLLFFGQESTVWNCRIDFCNPELSSL